jgi:hypothetical protein
LPRAHGEMRQGGDKAAPTSPVPGRRARKESWKRVAIHSRASINYFQSSSSLQRLLQAALKTSNRRRRFWLSSPLSAGRHAEPPSLVEGQSPHPSHHTRALSHTAGGKINKRIRCPEPAARDNYPRCPAAGRCYETLSTACVGGL